MPDRHRRRNLYTAVQALHQQHGFDIHKLCRLAGVPRSSYYKWLNCKSTDLELENQRLVEAAKSLYASVDGIYGYRRMADNLGLLLGKPINYKRMYRLLRQINLKSVIRRKRRKYRPSTPQQVAENLLNRDFTAKSPNEKWLTDVTELKYGNGQKAYLSAIIDLYDKSVIAYVIGHSNNNALVFRTLDLAREAAPGSAPMLHSDRGFQYTSLAFKRRIETYQMTQSMSRVGKCIDNGPMEGFWGILKCEKYYLHKYATFEDLKADIDSYISFYNHKRIQAKLNSLSPMEYRTKAA